MGQNTAKKSVLEANAQLLVVLRETKHRSLELCISGRANLAKVLRDFYAEVQSENVSL